MAVSPALGAWRLGCSFLLGCCLGIFYGFLRPLGTRHRHLADGIFSLAAVWTWLYISFALCRGDIRVIYLMGMVCGIFLWEKTVGLWLRPIFFLIWKVLGTVFRFVLFPLKKILEIAKILFASGEKWVTIKCTKIWKSRQKRREEIHGKQEHPAKASESGSSSRIQYP
jgi:hypothetical protein